MHYQSLSFRTCGVIWGLRFSLLPASFECSRRRVGAMAGLTLFPNRRRSATDQLVCCAAVASKQCWPGGALREDARRSCWSVVCLRQVEASQKGESLIQEAWHERGVFCCGRRFEPRHFGIIIAFSSSCCSSSYCYNKLKTTWRTGTHGSMKSYTGRGEGFAWCGRGRKSPFQDTTKLRRSHTFWRENTLFLFLFVSSIIEDGASCPKNVWNYMGFLNSSRYFGRFTPKGPNSAPALCGDGLPAHACSATAWKLGRLASHVDAWLLVPQLTHGVD